MEYRTTYLDRDNRREPKTNDYCVRCHRDFKPGAKVRWIHAIEGNIDTVIHPEDEHLYNDPAADMGYWKIGIDCAREIGIEYTRE